MVLQQINLLWRTVSYALVPAGAKLVHFGLREEIARDCEIVECLEHCQKVGSRFFYHKLKLEQLFDLTYSSKIRSRISWFFVFFGEIFEN